MEASLQAFALKSFIKVLQCLAKFGDDLHVHASPYDLRLSAVNQTKSAFCLVTLEPDFFHQYRLVGDAKGKGKRPVRAAADQDDGSRDVKCQLLVKSVLAVLSKQSSTTSVDMLELKIIDGAAASKDSENGRAEDDDDEAYDGRSIEARLIMKLICKHGVTKTHTLHVGASPFRTVFVDPSTTPSQFVVPSRLLREWLDHFPVQAASNTEHELGWHFGREEVRIKTFAMGGGGGGLQTSIGVGVDEFEEYFVNDTEVRVGGEEVGNGIKMTIPMKEFRAALTLSESFQVSLAARYSEATQPLVLNLEIDSCRAEIVIATTRCQAFDAVAEQAKGKSKSTTVPAQVSAPAPVPVPSMAKRKATQAASGATQAGRRLKLSSQAVIPESQFRSASQLDRPGSASQQQPLFLPGGSQREYVVDEEAEARSRQSQKVALEAAGLDGFKEDELLGMMEGDVTMEDGAAGAESLGNGDYGVDDDMRLDEDMGAEGSREKSETVVEDDDETTDKENEEEVIEDDEEALPPTGKPTNNFFTIYPS